MTLWASYYTTYPRKKIVTGLRELLSRQWERYVAVAYSTINPDEVDEVTKALLCEAWQRTYRATPADHATKIDTSRIAEGHWLLNSGDHAIYYVLHRVDAVVTIMRVGVRYEAGTKFKAAKRRTVRTIKVVGRDEGEGEVGMTEGGWRYDHSTLVRPWLRRRCEQTVARLTK